ncbi:UNVERIFIED_CONTAM: hypothetical protein GTU68_025628 [Idotea baltica]|nr:hypothetical protein [Idotea baltica]
MSSRDVDSSPSDNSEAFMWSVYDVSIWLENMGLSQYKDTFRLHRIDGLALMLLTEADLKQHLNVKVLGDVKRISASIAKLNYESKKTELLPPLIMHNSSDPIYGHNLRFCSMNTQSTSHLRAPKSAKRSRTYSSDSQAESADVTFSATSQTSGTSSGHRKSSGLATNLRPEYLKTLISCLYMFLVTWVTAIVMVFVHDRVPDKERHPPLPDIFLDNVPHISWAFQLCEITILLLALTWLIILFFHKHRSIMMRRFSALSGSVFLLRCATMFITSLSVPGHHLECAPRDQSDIWTKFHQASIIWRGGGLSIKGVRTCGDYMFSGHTTALTLLNFFITEYTPRRMYFLHIASWVLNTFGIFFILAAHEHYSIDVFIAFYITSRMFLYYHSLANNRALQQRDSFRTKIWFPMFSYFEADIDGIVPNEYGNPLSRGNFVGFVRGILCLLQRVRSFFPDQSHSSPSRAKKDL